MTWKKVANADAGTADKFGGNDLDKLFDSLNGVDVSDPINYNVDINALKANTNTLGDILKNNGTKYVRFTKGTANQVLAVNSGGTDIAWTTLAAGSGDITAGANVGTGTGQVFKDKTGSTLNFKRLAAGSNVTLTNGTNDVTIASTGGGGGAATMEGFSYIVYRDIDNSYKGRNGATGTVDFTHATDVIQVLAGIFNAMGGPTGTAPFTIKVGPGDFYVRDWPDNTFSREGRFSIIGSGMGITNFIVTNDVMGINGHNGCFRFAADSGSAFASNTVASNTPKNNRNISVSSITNLVTDCYIVIGSNHVTYGAAKDGEINRVVRITGTGPYTVELEKRTRDAYNTADAAFVRRLKMVTDVTLRDFTIKGDPTFDESTDFLRFDFADHINVEDVELYNFNGGFHSCSIWNSVINSRIKMRYAVPPYVNPNHDAATADGDFTQGHGYAISCRAACENLWFYPLFHGGSRHAFTTTANSETSKNGYPRNIHICDGTSDTTGEQAYDTHGEGYGIFFERCTVFSFRNGQEGGLGSNNDTSAFGFRSPAGVIRGCSVVNNWGTAFGISTESPNCKIEDVYVRNIVDSPNDALNIDGADCQIISADIADCDGGGINIGMDADECLISDSKIQNIGKTTAKSAIVIDTGRNGITMNNNHITDCSDHAIKLVGTNSFCSINGLYCNNMDHSAISMGAGCTNIQVSNVVARNCCETDNTLGVIDVSAGGTKDLAFNGIVIDTSNDAANIKPFEIDAGVEGVRIANTILTGGTIDSAFDGININWDHNTCKGRKISRPRYKIGRWEGTGNTSGATGLFEGQISHAGFSKRIETTDGTFGELGVATLNGTAGLRANRYTERDQNPYLRFRFRIESTTNLRFFAGLMDSESAFASGADPLANLNGIMVKLDTGVDNNIKLYTNNGDATTTTGATIQAMDTNRHILEFRADNANNGWQYRWDEGNWSALVTTDIPGTTNDLGMYIYLEALEAVNKNFNLLEVHTEVPQV